MSRLGALVHAWLVMDFFGDARRAGHGHSSSLTTTIFAQSFLAFVFAALLYPETPPVPFAAANLCLSTLLVAVGSLGDDGRPARFAVDQVLLGTAPIGRAATTLARGLHAAFYVVLVTIGMALAPAILLAHLRGDPLQALGYVACACASSGLAVGGLAVVTRAANRWLGRNRTALLAGSLKALLLGAGLVLFALGLQRLRGTADGLPIGRLGAELLPPYQFARWLAWPADESWRLLPLLGTGVLLAVAATLLSGHGEANTRAAHANSPLLRLLRACCGSGPTLGVAEFVAVTMWRSPGFRARVLPLLGVPAGMVFLVLQRERGGDLMLASVVLQLPAIYLPFLVAFLPRADQPGTHWVFAQAPELSVARVQDATWRALVTHVLTPVHAFALVAMTAALRDPAAAAAVLFAFGLAVLAARWMVAGLTQVPFTVAREGEQGVDLGNAFAAALVLGGIGAGFASLPSAWLQWAAAAATFALAVQSLRTAPPTAEADAVAALPSDNSGPAEPAEGQPAAAHATGENETEAPRPAPSLRRELRAIATLYAACCLLPWLVGTMFAE